MYGTQHSNIALFGYMPGNSMKELFYSGNFESIIQNCFDLISVHGFAIDAHDRFGSTETDEQPAAILEFELKTVHGDEFGHFQAAESLGVIFEDQFFTCF